MKIYETLESVLSPEQLDEFKAAVNEAIAEKVEEKTQLIEQKAEQYVEMVIEEKTEDLNVKAEEYVQLKLTDIKESLIKEYDEKLEEFETNIVESLDRFLDNEISESISESLLESVAEQQALLPLVEGIKSLFEKQYVALDTEGHGMIKQLQAESEELEAKLSEAIDEKIELSRLAESAATKLLIKEKSSDLTISESAKVEAFFEGKSFDEVSSKIEDYIALISEDTANNTSGTPILETEDYGLTQTKPKINSAEANLLSLVDRFL